MGIKAIIDDVQKYKGETFEFAGPEIKSIKEIVEHMKTICLWDEFKGTSYEYAKLIGYICEWFPNPRVVREDVT